MDDPPKDKEAKKEKEKRRRTVLQARDVSDEELVEREERVWVGVEPPPRTQPYPRSVSAGTGTTDDPFPPRRRKRKQQPPVPPERRIRTSREDVSQPELSSVDSLSVKKSPRSLRSLSSETQGPSRKLQHSQPSSIRLADSYLDSSDSFGNNSRREESAGRNRDIVIRRVDYDTAEVLKQETPTETQDPSNASVHWRASESSLSGEYHEGFTAGVCSCAPRLPFGFPWPTL